MPYYEPEKVEKLRARAARLEREANGKMAEFNRNRGDIAYLTQPAGGTAFGRQRQRAVDRYGKGLQLLAEAEELREKADRLETYGRPVKGDKAAQYQRIADKLDEVLAVGSRVFDWSGGNGTIVRVNRKTYRIEFDRGFTWTREKHFVRPLKDD